MKPEGTAPPVFRLLCMEDRADIERIRLACGHALSAHAFASLFLWREAMGLSVCFEEDAFLVRFQAWGEGACFFPCGTEDGKLALLRAAAALERFSLHYIREEDKAFLERHMPGRFRFEEARGDWEYLYRLSDQLALSGGAYKNLRSKVHKGVSLCCWTVEELNGGALERAAFVVRNWRDGGPDADRAVALKALEHYGALGLYGILLENADGPQGVALGSLITPDVFDLHVTKALLPNIDSYLKWELFRRLPSRVKWINQEEDLDISGLRTNKLESLPYSITPLWKGTAV